MFGVFMFRDWKLICAIVVWYAVAMAVGAALWDFARWAGIALGLGCLIISALIVEAREQRRAIRKASAKMRAQIANAPSEPFSYPEELKYHWTENAARYFAERDLGRPGYQYKRPNDLLVCMCGHSINDHGLPKGCVLCGCKSFCGRSNVN